VSWFEDFWVALLNKELHGWQLVFFWVVVAPLAFLVVNVAAWALVQAVFWIIDQI
jgi:hypothetical protein